MSKGNNLYNLSASNDPHVAEIIRQGEQDIQDFHDRQAAQWGIDLGSPSAPVSNPSDRQITEQELLQQQMGQWSHLFPLTPPASTPSNNAATQSNQGNYEKEWGPQWGITHPATPGQTFTVDSAQTLNGTQTQIPQLVNSTAVIKLIELGINVPAAYATGVAFSSDMLNYYKVNNPEYVDLIADILAASDL